MYNYLAMSIDNPIPNGPQSFNQGQQQQRPAAPIDLQSKNANGCYAYSPPMNNYMPTMPQVQFGADQQQPPQLDCIYDNTCAEDSYEKELRINCLSEEPFYEGECHCRRSHMASQQNSCDCGACRELCEPCGMGDSQCIMEAPCLSTVCLPPRSASLGKKLKIVTAIVLAIGSLAYYWYIKYLYVPQPPRRKYRLI